jgi:hypothetical protein
MESELSLPCSQEPAACPYPETVFLRTFNIILRHNFSSSEWFPPFRLSNQNFVLITYLPMGATYTAHLILFDLIVVLVKSIFYKLWSTNYVGTSQSIRFMFPCLIHVPEWVLC